MPLMRSPDGQEEFNVDLKDVRHYLQRGATLAEPLTEHPMDVPFQGGPEPALEDPAWYADPVNLGALLAGPTIAAPRAILGGTGRVAVGAARTTGQALTGPAGNLVIDALPTWPLRAGARGLRAILGRFQGRPAVEAVEEAAPAVTRSMARPIVGRAEAEAFRKGGQTRLDLLRAGEEAKQSAAAAMRRIATPEPVPAPTPAPAAAPVAKAAESAETQGARALARRRWEIARAKPKAEPTASAKRIEAAKPKPAAKAKESPKSEKTASEKRIEAVKGKSKPKVIEKPRHDVQYYQESKGRYINIEDMNQKHIEQAYRKLAATNPKPGSVGRKVLDALLDEAKYRLQTTGIHIGQAG